MRKQKIPKLNENQNHYKHTIYLNKAQQGVCF